MRQGNAVKGFRADGSKRYAGRAGSYPEEDGMDQVVRTACSHDCPDACALLVTVRDGRAVDVAPNPAHPITGRHLCVKVDRYLERVYSPDRVLHPLRRDGEKGSGQFVRISWDEALDTIAGRWRSILAEDGGEAILPYCYLGSMGRRRTSRTLT